MRETVAGILESAGLGFFMLWIILFALYSDVGEIYYMLIASIIFIILAKFFSKKKINTNDHDQPYSE